MIDQLQRLQRGPHRLACPECAVEKIRRKDTALSVEVTDDGGVYFCHRCGLRGGWSDQRSYAAAGTTRAPQACVPQHLLRSLVLAEASGSPV